MLKKNLPNPYMTGDLLAPKTGEWYNPVNVDNPFKTNGELYLVSYGVANEPYVRYDGLHDGVQRTAHHDHLTKFYKKIS